MRLMTRCLVPLFAGLLATSAPAQDSAQTATAVPQGEKVLKKASKAMGSDAAAKHENRVQKGTFSIPAQGMSGKFTAYTAPPNKFLNVVELAMIGEMRQGYDGTTAWSHDAMQGPRILGAEELEGMLVDANFDADLTDVFPGAETLGGAVFEGQDCWKLKLTMASGSETIAYFNKDSWLMVGMERKMSSPMGELPVTIVLSDYAEMQGMAVPKKTTMRMAGMEQVMTLDEVLVNVKDLPSFSPPPEVAALQKKN